ncbi:MAG: VCBS repeat-containing protein [Verrucomicrobia bacterium]|nr:VCBS repeat-containing protein [Verrucomicrobiota bacterium]
MRLIPWHSLFVLLFSIFIHSALPAQTPRLFPDFLARYPAGDTNASNPISATEGPKTLVAADLNGDGRADVIAGNLDGSISVLLGQTNRTLSEQILQPATNFLARASLRALAVADFNRDGKLDVAAADIASNNVVVLLGNGDGTLRQFWALQVGPARTLTTADFDHDGKADLLVACGPPDCEWWCEWCGQTNRFVGALRGKGDGTFENPRYLLGPMPQSCFYDVAAADVNQDGHPDALVLDFYRSFFPVFTQKRVLVFLNDGTGGFATDAPELALTPAGEGPRSITLAYVDEVLTNGVPPPGATLDLLVVNRDSASLDLFLNRGGLDFGAPISFPAGDSPRDVAVGDLDGDGRADLAVVNRNINSVSIFKGLGGGRFLPQLEEYPTGVSPRQIVLADLNGDGVLDAAVNNRVSEDVSIFTGQRGLAGFLLPENYYPAGYTPVSVVAEDFNGDGLPDVASANLRSHDLRVRLNQGGGVLGAETMYPVNNGPGFLVAGDLNKDGKLDLVVSCLGAGHGSGVLSRGSLVTLLGRGDGTFAAPVSSPLGSGVSRPFWLQLGDLSGDGILDLAVGGVNGALLVFKGVGDGTFEPGLAIGLRADGRPLGLAVGDFDRNGRLDIACSRGLVFLNDGQFFAGTNVITTNSVWPGRTKEFFSGNQAWAVEAEDLDNDGILDLMVALTWRRPDPVGVYFGLGDGAFNFPTIYEGPDVGVVALTGRDMDADGVKDIVVGNRCAASSIILKGLGQRTFTYHEIVHTPSVEDIAVADMNRDGRPDIVGAGIGVWVMLNQGTNRLATPRLVQPGFGPERPGLFINEIMALNQRFFVFNGNTPDWIELYNHSATAQSLAGWALARVPVDEAPTVWFFPGSVSIGAESNLVVYCKKKAGGVPGLQAAFDLSAEGETVVLFRPGLIEADRVEFPSLPADVSYARFLDGARFFCYNPAPTPGAPNMRPGNLKPSIERKQPFVGTGATSLGLTGRAFDDVAVAYASVSYRVEGATNFTEIPLNDDGLSGDKEADDGYFGLMLPPLPPGTTVEYYLRVADLEGQENTTPDNPEDATQLHRVTAPAPGSAIRLSELMADNQSGLRDEFGELEDWLELVNTGRSNVCLGGLYLTRDYFERALAWPLPDLCLDPGAHAIVFCDEELFEGPLHVSFKLPRTGDRVFLVDGDTWTIADSLSFGTLPPDTSFGILGSGTEAQLLAWPTPGAANISFPHTQNPDGMAPEVLYRMAPMTESGPSWVTLRWLGNTNGFHRVQFSTNLATWSFSPTDPAHLGQGIHQWSDAAPPAGQCFYRVVVQE